MNTAIRVLLLVALLQFALCDIDPALLGPALYVPANKRMCYSFTHTTKCLFAYTNLVCVALYSFFVFSVGVCFVFVIIAHAVNISFIGPWTATLGATASWAYFCNSYLNKRILPDIQVNLYHFSVVVVWCLRVIGHTHEHLTQTVGCVVNATTPPRELIETREYGSV